MNSSHPESHSSAEICGLHTLFWEDLRTHHWKLFEQGFWAITVHRYGRRIQRIRPTFIRAPFSLIYLASAKIVQWMCGISIYPSVQMGRRVRIWHHGGIIITARFIGNDVHIRQNTTLGMKTMDRTEDWPIIEDRVDIGCGACILGAITIGHDSLIGANAVVLRDVPPNSVAVGVPARILPKSVV